MRIPAHMIQVGDLVDLEGDAYADPRSDNPYFRCELATVASIDAETSNCIAIGVEGFDVVGFPADHLLNVKGHSAVGTFTIHGGETPIRASHNGETWATFKTIKQAWRRVAFMRGERLAP